MVITLEVIIKDTPTNVTCFTGLNAGLAAIFFRQQYIVVHTHYGQIKHRGNTKEQLTQVQHLEGSTVAAFNLARSTIVVLRLNSCETLREISVNFNLQEQSNTLHVFKKSQLLAISARTANFYSVTYYTEGNQQKQMRFGTDMTCQKLTEQGSIVLYNQYAQGNFKFSILSKQSQQDVSLPIEQGLVQQIWQLNQSYILGININNFCQWCIFQNGVLVKTHQYPFIIYDTLLFDKHSGVLAFVSLMQKDGRHRMQSLNVLDGSQYSQDIEYRLATQTNRRTFVVCTPSKDGLRLTSRRFMRKENKYIHLLKKINCIQRYGTCIVDQCLELLN